MKKLPSQPQDMFRKLNELIDLVNSQQEAIEKLEENQITAVMENLDTMKVFWRDKHFVLRNSEPADDKPENKNYKLVTESEPFDRVEYEKAKFVRDREKVRFAGLDTHRTVTLRIPKGMTIGDAFNLAYLFSDSSWEEFITRSDTDLQKALDEVKE